MTKKYFYIFLFILCFASFSATAQESGDNFNNKQPQPTVIEGLSIYPNPTTTGRITISSRLGSEKKVEIFDVLGKKVLDGTTSNGELNVNNLSAGVYIIKIKEGDNSATRKLIVK